MAYPGDGPPPPQPTLALDGTESIEGRALFLISALYWCQDWLPAIHLRMIDVTNENVLIGLETFTAETGIAIEVAAAGAEAPLHNARGYVAVAFRSALHLRLDQARAAAIPTLLALQFPDPEWLCPAIVLRRPAALDPRLLAADIKTLVSTWP